VLIESTCNQVNQYGGYTGMTPVAFTAYVAEIADRLGFSRDRLILGGDHLGPNVWQNESAKSALTKSHQMVWDYVAAGYCKIHLDASMKCADDPSGPLAVDVAAKRAAELAETAEAAFQQREDGLAPRYVIGTEVPIAGGVQGENEPLQVTTVPDLAETLEKSRAAFLARGLESAWERVIAVVVQPGVEYGDASIYEYDRAAAADLVRFIEDQPLVYEAHSTDYQTRQALRQMVEDHFAILKVGPALTYAYREAVFALAIIEEEWLAGRPDVEYSHLRQALENAMLGDPQHWGKYYRGDLFAQAFARRYSFSDRSRYYWSVAEVQAAIGKLMFNLGEKPIPLTLLSQFMPEQYVRIRTGELENTPLALIEDQIISVFEDYRYAVGE
jgi:D-tagatose-1,6-bisphosphate aldolase subunit GatZ/KbaZ